MDNIVITATSIVTGDDVRAARLGTRFGRLDLLSQVALLAVEPLVSNFGSIARERIGICLAARAGSLPTDVEYWNGREATGGPSPTLFAYTLPSAAVGEIAIRHRLTGPNLCFVGSDAAIVSEAADWLSRGLVDGCLCVSSNVVSEALARMIQAPPAARACALFLQRGSGGLQVLGKNDRDMESLCARFRA